MWKQVKEDLVFFNTRFDSCLDFPIESVNFLTQTWNLQKSFLLGEVWVFNYSGCYHKALLWRSSKWEFEVTFQTTGTYGQDNGSSSKGSYLCFHEAFASLQPCSWSQVPKIDLSPLQYALGVGNVHWEAIDVSFYIGHEWTKGILVEILKPIWCVEQNNKIFGTWILEWNFW